MNYIDEENSINVIDFQKLNHYGLREEDYVKLCEQKKLCYYSQWYTSDWENTVSPPKIHMRYTKTYNNVFHGYMVIYHNYDGSPILSERLYNFGVMIYEIKKLTSCECSNTSDTYETTPCTHIFNTYETTP